jgi:hypothetical protein
MGMTELEEGEEGSGGGRRLIKTTDFAEEEHGRNFHGSRASATATLKSPAQRQREPGSGETNPRGVSRVQERERKRGAFACREPSRQLGHANQTGRVAAGERRPPPWLYIKQDRSDFFLIVLVDNRLKNASINLKDLVFVIVGTIYIFLVNASLI